LNQNLASNLHVSAEYKECLVL